MGFIYCRRHKQNRYNTMPAVRFVTNNYRNTSRVSNMLNHLPVTWRCLADRRSDIRLKICQYVTYFSSPDYCGKLLTLFIKITVLLFKVDKCQVRHLEMSFLLFSYLQVYKSCLPCGTVQQHSCNSEIQVFIF